MKTNKDNRLQDLLRQYFAGKITEDEYHELWNLMQEGTAENALSEELQLLWEEADAVEPVIDAAAWNEKMKQLLKEKEPIAWVWSGENKPVKKPYKWYMAAAAAILVLLSGLYLYRSRVSLHPVETVALVSPEDLMPGGNKAVLTLSNGAAIRLDSNVNGVISQQGNAQVVKAAGGQIAYNQVGTAPDNVVYNTLSTPRGGQYEITLPDSTRVWLNAASSLRFPTSFLGDKRVVHMTGEAYFDVAANAKKPFIVMVDGMQVKVLGTRFNIMAYDDEPLVKTTLLSGAVSVRKAGAGVRLAPGEQAQLDKEDNIRLVKQVHLGEIVAWKNNLFWFEGNTIQEVMRQVARWYNVDVVIKGDIRRHFTGSIPRDVKVSKVFEVLEETGSIHFTLQKNKIMVSP